MRPGEAREAYGRAARGYDALLDLWFDRILRIGDDRHRARAVAALGLERGDTVLDLGCGTGKSFGLLHRAVGPGGRIVGLDVTPAMLRIAKKRAAENRWRNVRLVRGDAARADRLVGGKVDGVLAAYSLGIMPEPGRAIEASARLLRRGRRMAVLDCRALRLRGLLAPLDPLVGLPVRRLVERYGIAGAGDYARERPWREMMEEHLRNVSYREHYFGFFFLASGAR